MPPVRNETLEARRLRVRGQVQGVGFRPFVYRLAKQSGLSGRVFNDPAGVCIEVEGSPDDLTTFRRRLANEAPAAARVDACDSEIISPLGQNEFRIDFSTTTAPPQVRVPRDLAVCAECLDDIETADNRRHVYPFTSCTACGPRYSILTGLPYDRPLTSMKCFPMCRACGEEYHRPEDRRFHAQPIACADCGPRVALWDNAGQTLADHATAVDHAAESLRRGDIVALKGLGGFQLLALAENAEAVRRLRVEKRRPTKPLAVMVPDLGTAEKLARLGPVERRLLVSPENPIVLCDRTSGVSSMADEIAPRTATLGLFLPTTPLHHLLLSRLGCPVVATSGNVSEEPIVLDEKEAVRRLGTIADVFLVHDRPIVRRLDDSVIRVLDKTPSILRLARGYAPLPIPALETLAKRREAPPLLAVGGHQKASLALWSGSQAVLAQHVGDLDHPETRTAFEGAVQDLVGLYLAPPSALACDLHTDYFSTRWVVQHGKPIHRAQHHHAHAAACMAEHGLLDREVLALCWDGTGYGRDGTVWGGEILRATLRDFERVASLMPFPLPGGEKAIRHPARVAFGLLYVLLGESDLLGRDDLLRRLNLTTVEARLLAAMIRRGVNCPWTTSMGRLFDGVAALTLGALSVTYEGEAAVWLEAVAEADETGEYPMPLTLSSNVGDWRSMIQAILKESEPGRVSARFHNTMARWAVQVAERHPLPDVVLGGGCFQNRLLTERVAARLRETGRRVYGPGLIPANDGGLAAGQLAVALERLQT